MIGWWAMESFCALGGSNLSETIVSSTSLVSISVLPCTWAIGIEVSCMSGVEEASGASVITTAVGSDGS